MAAFDRKLTLHRRNAAFRALAVAPLLVTLAAVVFAWLGRAPDHGALWPLVIDPTVLALVLSVYVRRRNPWPTKRLARVVADARGVTVDGESVLDRSAVQSGYIQPFAGGPPTVRLVGRLGVPLLEVEVRDEGEGRELLDALELGVSHKATLFSGNSPIFASTVRRIGIPIAFAALGMAAGFFFQTPVLVPAVFALGFLPLAAPALIRVGADGVLVSWLWRRRFFAYTEIAGVKAYTRGVRLWLHSGDAIDVPVVASRRSRVLDRMRLDALVARIQAGLEAAREGKQPVEVASLVARGGRTAEEWARAVRRILGGDGGDYRTSAVPEENLWRVAEDATAEETARVGAAVALRMHLDDDGRARMLRVAEASVSPKVRVAIRAAASAEDDALLEALAAYDGLVGDSREEEKKRSSV